MPIKLHAGTIIVHDSNFIDNFKENHWHRQIMYTDTSTDNSLYIYRRQYLFSQASKAMLKVASHAWLNMKVLKLLCILCCTVTSYNKMIDCSDKYQQGLSLYQRICCNISNMGQAVTIKENGLRNYIFCPATLPTSCPGIGL